MGGPESAWECYNSRNIVCLAWKKQRDKIRECCQISKFLQAGELLVRKHRLPFKKQGRMAVRKGQQSLCGSKGWSIEPQRIILRPWKLMEVSLLFFKTCLELVSFYSFRFSLSQWDCLPMPLSPFYWGSRNFLVPQSQNKEKMFF